MNYTLWGKVRQLKEVTVFMFEGGKKNLKLLLGFMPHQRKGSQCQTCCDYICPGTD